MDNDQKARDYQYAYAANANLVLQVDRSQLPRRDKEPSGEPETLWGKLDPKLMGDRAQRQASDKPVQPKRSAAAAAQQNDKKKRKVDLPSSINDADAFEGLTYRPRSAETREAYALILNFCSPLVGDSDQALLRSAVDEVLALLKNADMKDFDRKKEIEAMFGESLPSENYAQLVSLGKKITDYEAPSAEEQPGEDLDQNVGVAVVFDEDEESDQEGFVDMSGSENGDEDDAQTEHKYDGEHRRHDHRQRDEHGHDRHHFLVHNRVP
jgi:pre-mRNA-splicing helicase BRR2